jgi:predicted secreted Zn-dependent protease
MTDKMFAVSQFHRPPRGSGRLEVRLSRLAAMAGQMLLLTALLAVPAWAQSSAPRITLKVTASTNYYEVSGNTHAELIASRAQARPRKDNQPFDGLTTWNVEWSYRLSSRNGQHALESADVKTKVVVTLPRWSPAPGADADLVARWQKYVRALGIHELGHVSYARLATAEMGKRLSAIQHRSTAQDLRTLVERTGDQVLAEFRSKDAEYDRDTAHGVKQGAHFRW